MYKEERTILVSLNADQEREIQDLQQRCLEMAVIEQTKDLLGDIFKK
jgi:hypothetical protein